MRTEIIIQGHLLAWRLPVCAYAPHSKRFVIRHCFFFLVCSASMTDRGKQITWSKNLSSGRVRRKKCLANVNAIVADSFITSPMLFGYSVTKIQEKKTTTITKITCQKMWMCCLFRKKTSNELRPKKPLKQIVPLEKRSGKTSTYSVAPPIDVHARPDRRRNFNLS